MHSNLKYSLKHLKKKRPLKQVMRQQIPYQVAHRAHLPVSYLVLSSQYLVTSPGFFFSFSFLKSCSNSMISFPPPLCFYSCFLISFSLHLSYNVVGFSKSPKQLLSNKVGSETQPGFHPQGT